MKKQNTKLNTEIFENLRQKLNNVTKINSQNLAINPEITKLQPEIMNQVFYVGVTDKVFKTLSSDTLDFMEFKNSDEPNSFYLTYLTPEEYFINCYLTKESALKTLPKGYKVVKTTFLTLEYFFTLFEYTLFNYSGIAIFDSNTEDVCILEDSTMLLLTFSNRIFDYPEDDEEEDEIQVDSIEEIRSLYKDVLKDTNPDTVFNFYDAIRNHTVYVPVNDYFVKESDSKNLDLDYVIKHDLIDFSFVLPGSNGGFTLGVFSSLDVAKDCGPTDTEYYSIRFKDYVKGFMKWIKPDMKLEGVCIDPLIGTDMMYVPSANMKVFSDLEYECFDVYEPER